FRIDSLMIPQFISNQANVVFSIGVNLANAVMIPATGVFALCSPLLSKSLKIDDLSLLQIKYSEVARNLFFIGIILYGCVILGMHDLFELLPTADKLIPILPVLYILGGNVVLNMAMGFNTEIIAYSKHYRFNLTAIILLGVLNIGLNYHILTQTNYGIIGVAWASLFAMSVFNMAKLWFIYKQFNILPFNRSYLKTVVVSLALLLFFYWLPITMVEGFDFVIRCGLYVLVLSSLLYRLGWVPEWNKSVDKFRNRFIG